MATASNSAGTSGVKTNGASMHKYDRDFTQAVIDLMGPRTAPRTRQVLGSLIRHIHDFAREVELTNDEWLMGVNFINTIGQISTPTRNEGHRICDVIGLETLVDEIAHKLVLESGAESPTSSSILGPFWSPHAPFRKIGDTIVRSPHTGQVSLMRGRITDLVTKRGIPNAIFDIWQASSNGKYDFQDPENQEPNNLRGKFRTDNNGFYHLYILHPTAYSLPTDGPAGVLLDLLDRHPFRPAHIHLMISHPEYKSVTTQIFPRDDQYLSSDTVFAVKNDLVVDFKPLKGDPKAELELEYNIRLAPNTMKTISHL
ncbi:uncharacterized protein PADG_01897 [Paracoccidioides brasiliensis Pb18]|uniref:Intradiol ring-cleavage dioxygenases domain-containing protein n=1 Tax=Paracoccidioides brasiliensis (strain Pb18) TaxID=502780 RepID=C1G4N1_PARBD|nr:uncharacterized protein PADG_01897 [Paracoccidioides brasiliensis Pb18]EEH45747.1 hypothetical protein PADG_01897 [Paracoccidioides brasiliensis Pb18]